METLESLSVQIALKFLPHLFAKDITMFLDDLAAYEWKVAVLFNLLSALFIFATETAIEALLVVEEQKLLL